MAGASRRIFLQTASVLAGLGVSAPVAMQLAASASAAAQSASDYKAIVCLHLAGGNDAFNTLIPADDASFAQYATTRARLAMAKPAQALGGTRAHAGRTLALNAALAGMQELYAQRRLAVVANVGPLVGPSARADLETGRVRFPPQIGSHKDQETIWMTNVSRDPCGWGGRIGDMLASVNGANVQFTTMSGTGGFSSFLVGAQTSFFAVSDGGVPAPFFRGDPDLGAAILGRHGECSNLLEQAYVDVHASLYQGAQILQSHALPEAAFPAPEAHNQTAAQLRTLARIIGAHQALGLKRQIFFVELEGFDTHSAQLNRHAALMHQLNAAISYFDTLTRQLGLSDNVVLFTSSEFGRAYAPNSDGTDHGWGSHHFVAGGAVRGGEIYGVLPDMTLRGPDFVQSNLLIPTTAVAQYGATLARWLGVSEADIDVIFPSLSRFGARDLGFL